MTNFEKIKQMNVDEMAELLVDKFKCLDCECVYNCNACLFYIKRWLESEAEENDIAESNRNNNKRNTN